MSSAKWRPFCVGLNVLNFEVRSLQLIWGSNKGIVLFMHPANERGHYIAMWSLIGKVHTQNNPWNSCSFHLLGGKWRRYQDCSPSNSHCVTCPISMVSCQKGPTRHAYAWRVGPFWQDTIDLTAFHLCETEITVVTHTITLPPLSCFPCKLFFFFFAFRVNLMSYLT